MLTQDLTTGPIGRHVLRMGAPMFVGMLVNNLYGLADLFWVSRLPESAVAVAATSLAYNLTIAVMAIGQVLTVGAVAPIAQAAGRRDDAAVRQLFHQATGLSLLAALLFALPVFLARHWLGEHFAGDAATAAVTADVLFWFAPALGLMIPMLVLAAALRGIGDVRTAIRVQLGSVLMNMVFAPVMVFGIGLPHPLGAPGAAAATLVSVTIALAILMQRVLRQRHYLGLDPAEWKPRVARWLEMLRIGLPAGSEFALMGLFFGYVMWVLARFGPEAQAAFGIGMRWMQLGLLPALALGFASAAVAGQNLGAGSIPRVRATLTHAATIGLATSIVSCAIYQLIPGPLVRVFSDDPEVLQIGIEMVRILSLNLLASSLVMTYTGVFSGLGETVPPFISSIVRYGIVIVAIAVTLNSHHFSIALIWWMQLLATALQVVLNAIFMRTSLRRPRKLAGGTEASVSVGAV